MNALILVDIQNDFLPGGALAVNDGDQILPLVNELLPLFPLVVATQDWHPADHGSFAANHSEKEIGQVIDLHGLDQVLWPVHCVQGSKGAEFVKTLKQDQIAKIFKKGTDQQIDSYSGFFDNGHRKATGLAEYLLESGVTTVYIVGLATDYCVKFTALDARRLGFETYLIEDGCRGVNLLPEDVQNSITEMQAAGVKIIQSSDLLNEELK